MRSDHQSLDLHYFHMFATKDRVHLQSASEEPPCTNPNPDLNVLLPSDSDREAMLSNFGIFVARKLVQYMPFFEGHFSHQTHSSWPARDGESVWSGNNRLITNLIGDISSCSYVHRFHWVFWKRVRWNMKTWLEYWNMHSNPMRNLNLHVLLAQIFCTYPPPQRELNFNFWQLMRD